MATVAPISANTLVKTESPVFSAVSSPTFRHPFNRQMPTATFSDPVKPDSDLEIGINLDSTLEAWTVAGKVAAYGIEIPADSESQ